LSFIGIAKAKNKGRKKEEVSWRINKSSSLEQLIWKVSRAAKTKPKEEPKKILICLS